jgi:hypothetical protein
VVVNGALLPFFAKTTILVPNRLTDVVFVPATPNTSKKPREPLSAKKLRTNATPDNQLQNSLPTVFSLKSTQPTPKQ